MEVSSFRKLVNSGGAAKVAAIDPGLNTAGYCTAVVGDNKVTFVTAGSSSSIVIADGRSVGKTSLAIEKARQVSLDLFRVMLSEKPSILIVETPPQRFSGNAQSQIKKAQDARMLFGMSMVIYGLLLSKNSEIDLIVIEPSQWQPGFARGNTKGWSAKLASRVCSFDVNSEHAADAVSMLYSVSGLL